MSILFSWHTFSCEQMELPEWADIVKTAQFKELAPYDPDWYYVSLSLLYVCASMVLFCNLLDFVCISLFVQYCAASMARKIYLRGGLGVGSFRRIYGGSKRNGSRPPHFCKSSGAVARNILQQLQEMNIIDLDTKG